MPGGSCDDKLDAALIVRVPVEKDHRQFVPGRPSVYIIPGHSLDKEPEEMGGRRFLSNTNVAACLLLEPTGDLGFDLTKAADAASSHDVKRAGQAQWQVRDAVRGIVVEPLPQEWEKKDDQFDDPSLPMHQRKLVSFTAKVAQPRERQSLWKERHEIEEHTDKGRPLWIEDITRFTTAEMAAALNSLERAQLRLYGLAFHFSTRESTEAMIRGGGIASSEIDGKDCVPAWAIRPAKLGWDAGGEKFQQNVGRLVYGEQWDPTGKHADQVQVMTVLRVPMHVLGSSKLGSKVAGRVLIPDDMLRDAPPTEGAGGTTGTATRRKIYPSAHVVKCYGVSSMAPKPKLQQRLRSESKLVVNSMQFTNMGPPKRAPPSLDGLVHDRIATGAALPSTSGSTRSRAASEVAGKKPRPPALPTSTAQQRQGLTRM